MKRSKIIAIGLVCILFGSVLSVIASRTITDTSDTILSQVSSSAGYYNTATAANVQAAVNSLNNATGWVDCNSKFINLSTTLYLGDYCELRNFNFSMTNTMNETMIRNYTNRGKGIKIHDGRLDGNSYGQPTQWVKDTHSVAWYNSSFKMYDQPCGIFLIGCDNASVENVMVYDTTFGALIIQQSKYNTVTRTHVFDAGRVFETKAIYTATPTHDRYSAGGIFLFNCSDSIIDGCIINNTYSFGIGSEGFLTVPATPWYWRAHHNLITNCIVTNTTEGLYVGEDNQNMTIENCIIKEGKLKNIPYATSVAIGTGGATADGIHIINCMINRYDNGIGLAAGNVTIMGCKFDKIDRYAIELSGDDIIISGNNLKTSGSHQIYLNGASRVSLTGNHIYGGGNGAYAVVLASTNNVSFSCNDIRQRALWYPYEAIHESGTADWTKCDASNSFAVYQTYPASGGVKLIGSHSYNIMINASARTIGINTSAGITWRS